MYTTTLVVSCLDLQSDQLSSAACMNLSQKCFVLWSCNLSRAGLGLPMPIRYANRDLTHNLSIYLCKGLNNERMQGAICDNGSFRLEDRFQEGDLQAVGG
jgi:hypothetical protein